MQKPLQITYRNTGKSVGLTSLVNQKVSKLERFYPDLISCVVTVEIPNLHQHTGHLFNLRLHLKTPDKEFDVTSNSSEDAYLGLREVFAIAKRGIENHMRHKPGNNLVEEFV